MALPWEPDYVAEWKRRYELNKAIGADPTLIAASHAYYKNNPVAWINDWAVTFDPRRTENRIMPMMMFAKQEEFVCFLWFCYFDKENGLVEKARDIGASWICCAFSVWLWLYHDGTAIGWGSRKEEYVDKKDDPKALFPKMRMIIRFLPVWMRPIEWNADRDSPYMRIINRENSSTITGEAGTNQGRGGRTSIYFKDESAHYDDPESIEAALGDNTDVQIDISSVNGTGNVFHRKRMAGELWYPGAVMTRGKTRIFVFDWRDHPNKTQEWYDLRRARAEEEGLLHLFAQEVDRDYAASVEGIIIPAAWVEAAIDAHKALGIEITGERAAGQDLADSDTGDKNALIIRHGILCLYANHWPGESDAAAKIAIPVCNEHGVTDIYYDASGGYGGGFKTECNNMATKPGWNARMKIHPWLGGGKVLDPDKPSIKNDKGSGLNKDLYKNFKAQAWYRVRSRFSRTYRAVRLGEVFPHEELISIDSTIPLLHQLKMELSQPTKKQDDIGKFTVDKKPDGTKSPNLADGFVQCYNPVRKVTSFDGI